MFIRTLFFRVATQKQTSPPQRRAHLEKRIHGVLITGVSVGLAFHFQKRENMFFLSICKKIPTC